MMSSLQLRDMTLLDYDHVISAVNVPMVFMSWSGGILKATDSFGLLVGLSPEQLVTDKWFIYELLTADSLINYIEKIASISADPSTQAVVTGCVLVKRGLRHLTHNGQLALTPFSWDLELSDERLIRASLSASIKKDSFGLPVVIIVSFIPLENDPFKRTEN